MSVISQSLSLETNALRPDTDKRVVFVIEYTAMPEFLDVQAVLDKAHDSGVARIVDVRIVSDEPARPAANPHATAHIGAHMDYHIGEDTDCGA